MPRNPKSKAGEGRVLSLSPDGDDRATGDRASPWKTLARANAALMPGDTAVLLPGAYPGTISPERSGRPGAPIGFRSEERWEATLTGNGTSRPAIELLGRSHLSVEGFRIAPGDGRWLHARGCDHLLVAGCVMERAGRNWAPLVIQECDHVRLIDNVFRKDQVTGNMCNLLACSHVLIEGNAFTRVGHNPLLLDTVNYGAVRANCFHNEWGRNYEFWASARILVEGNVVTEALDSAESADSRAKNALVESIIRFNRVYGNRHTPLDSPSYVPRLVWTPHIREPFRLVDTRIYHNTVTDNLGHGWDLWGLNVSANVFVNNIFYLNDKYGEGVQLTLTEGLLRDNRFHHNVFRGPEAGRRTIRNGAESWTTDEAEARSPLMGDHWRAFERNLDADPRFVDPANHDYRLRPDSPCIDGGRPLTRTTRAGKGREVPVADPRYFFDGFGIEGERGDWIAIGRGDAVARIERVEIRYYQPGILFLDRELEWEADAPVSLPWRGEAPDIGAHEYGTPALRPAIRIEPANPRPGRQARFRLEGLGEDGSEVSWSLGDGGEGGGMEVSRAYERQGQYAVRARFRRRDGEEGLDIALTRVTEPPAPDAPLLTGDFEDETAEAWGHLFYFHRQRGTDWERSAPGFRSGWCARLFAREDGATLGCRLAPGEWDIDAYPIIRFAYRIPKGVPVGICLQAFPKMSYGEGTVMIGGTPARERGPYPDVEAAILADDGEWREIALDARTIRRRLPDVRHLRQFRFYTHQNATRGQEFWFDEFAILPDPR